MKKNIEGMTSSIEINTFINQIYTAMEIADRITCRYTFGRIFEFAKYLHSEGITGVGTTSINGWTEDYAKFSDGTVKSWDERSDMYQYLWHHEYPEYSPKTYSSWAEYEAEMDMPEDKEEDDYSSSSSLTR